MVNSLKAPACLGLFFTAAAGADICYRYLEEAILDTLDTYIRYIRYIYITFSLRTERDL